MGCARLRRAHCGNTNAVQPTARASRRPLIGCLFHWRQDRCLARLGRGVGLVALTAAAHAWSCGSLVACAGRASPGPGEAHEGFALLEAALPSRLDNPAGPSMGERNMSSAVGRVVLGMDPHKRSVTIE